jgi:hypothetical protein
MGREMDERGRMMGGKRREQKTGKGREVKTGKKLWVRRREL